MKSCNFLTIIILIFFFPAINSQDGTVVFEEEILWEWSTENNIYGGYGFYWWHRNEGTVNINFGQMSSTDWTQPNDYYNGEFVLRFEILDQPTSEPFMLQMGIWQDKPKGSVHPETVSSRQYIDGGKGSAIEVSLGSPAEWWNKQPEDLVDFSRPEDFYRIGLVLWNPDPLCIPMGTDWSSSGCPENADKFFPLRAKVKVLAIPAGRQSKSDLTFRIRDEHSNTIQDATIDIDGKQLKTNAEGLASIELEYGQYDYSVTKDNYKEITGSISLSEAEVYETVIFELISSIQSVENGNINIYPNPADEFISIHSENGFSSNSIVEVYQLDGKKILSKNLSQESYEMTIDISGLEQGVYIVHVLSEKERYVSRVVVR